jgi:KaiC/GvpD/RAD55 family RecA-like ATPase
VAPVLGPIGDLSSHALNYAEAGMEVFPLFADKTPRTANGMKDATSDVAVVASWWERWSDALIGCRIPPDMVVIDVDPKHNGMATWKALRETYGEGPFTRGHQSGRNDGGGHLWFRRPPGRLSIRPLNRWAKEHGTGQAAGKHSWVAGVDLLHHDHRYTILPPSPHPATGAPYHWGSGHGLEVSPAEAPGWLVALITEERPPPAPPVPPLAGPEVDSIADWFCETTSFADLLIPEGWTLVAGNGDADGSKWRHPNATASASASVKNNCLFVYTPNTDFEVTSEGEPHGYTRFRAYATLAHRDDLSAAARHLRGLRNTPSNGAARDWSWVTLTTGTGKADGGDLVRLPDDGLVPIHWPDFWKREHPEEDWLVEPVIPRGRQVVLWAIHKTGKSLLALELAAAAATRWDCFGLPAKDAFDVIYLDMEMTEDDLYDRLTSFGYGPEVDLERLHYYLIPSLPPLDTQAGSEVLLGLVERHRAALVVIDTMARVIYGEENSADTYRAYSQHTGLRLRAQGVSVLRLDHGGKDPGQGQRGSSAKGDDVDLVWQLRAMDNGLELERSATRIPWAPERVTLRRQDDPRLAHLLALDMEWPAGTRDLANLLDSIGVPLDAGRRTARAVLAAAKETAANDLLGKALKYRRRGGLGLEELL